MTLTDRAFFAQNPNANLRIRHPAPGEVNELARRIEPDAPVVDMSQAPAGSSWRVAVIEVGARTHVKLLVLHHDGDPEDEDRMRLHLLAMGSRIAIDKISRNAF